MAEIPVSSEPISSGSSSHSVSARDPYSDPLFLHAADSSSVVLVSTKLVDESNYGTWSRAIQKALLAKNKLGFILGTQKQPPEEHPDSGSWLRCNAMVCTWLNNSVEPDVASMIVYLDDAYEIWKHLESQYQQQNVSKIFSIQQQIDGLHQGSLDLNSYYSKLKFLWEELKHHEPLSVCNCGGCSCGGCKCRIAQQWIDLFDRRNVMRFLMRLNESYTAVRRQILMLDPLPSLSKAYNLVAQEERQRRNVTPAPDAVTFQTTTQFPRSTISGSPNSRPRSTNPGMSSHSRSRHTCTHCGLQGHTVNRCFKIHGYPPGYKSSSNWSARTSTSQKPKFSGSEKFQTHVNMIGSSQYANPVVDTLKFNSDVSSGQSLLEQAQFLMTQFLSQQKGHGSTSTDSNPATLLPPSPGPYSGLDDWQGYAESQSLYFRDAGFISYILCFFCSILHCTRRTIRPEELELHLP